MKYQIGDIVNFEKHEYVHRKFSTAIISGCQKQFDSIIRYYGYATPDSSIVIIIDESSIISYGEPKDIISDHVIKDVLDPKVKINTFFKCAMIHLIRTSDEFDLQILNKCNSLVNPLIGDYLNTQAVLDMIFLKNNLPARTTFTGSIS